jgi:hypothetical protein
MFVKNQLFFYLWGTLFITENGELFLQGCNQAQSLQLPQVWPTQNKLVS